MAARRRPRGGQAPCIETRNPAGPTDTRPPTVAPPMDLSTRLAAAPLDHAQGDGPMKRKPDRIA